MKKLILLPVILILCITLCHAEDLNALRKDDVTILYDDGLENAAVSAARIYPDVRKALEKIIGWDADFNPVIYLVKDHERFIHMSGHPLVVGYAVPEKLLIVIDYSKMLTDPFSISSIMKHELCHLLLHRNIHKENLPKWLDEGVSQWVSGGLADIIMAGRSPVDRAIVTGRQIPFRYLSRGFPRDNEPLILAYAQSKSLVVYMAGEYNTAGIQALLSSLKNGNDIESSVYMTFRVTFDELEKNWYSAMKKKATWLTLLISHLYEIVFFFGAISLIIAYVKITIRKRAQRDEEDDHDLREYP
ncbi:MAG: peptidase MA family metallohydrolase [Desulfobacteraceae bacterium]|jgi:hypothetical protein